MMSGIFISYRRSDVAAEVKLLAQELSSAFPGIQVFLDIETIFPGSDFVAVLNAHLKKTSVLLVVIGPEWLFAADSDGTIRLNDPNDFVRTEIAASLKRSIPIIPVLFRQASMPAHSQLPPEISQLASYQAISIGPKFERIQVLQGALRRYLSWFALDRVTSAVASGAALTAIILALVAGFVAAGFLAYMADYFWPTESGVTENLQGGSLLGVSFSGRDKTLFDCLFFGTLVSPLAILAFVIGAVMETRVKNILRLMILTSAYAVVIWFSLLNFIFIDSLTNIYVQVFIDAVLVFLSLSFIYALNDIPLSGLFQRASRTALAAGVLILGLAIPGLFLLTFFSWKLHVIKSYHIASSDYITWIAIVLSLATSVGMFRGKTSI